MALASGFVALIVILALIWFGLFTGFGISLSMKGNYVGCFLLFFSLGIVGVLIGFIIAYFANEKKEKEQDMKQREDFMNKYNQFNQPFPNQNSQNQPYPSNKNTQSVSPINPTNNNSGPNDPDPGHDHS